MDKSLLVKGLSEFKSQARIVSEEYGGRSFRWMISMLWCLFRYGARPIDYVRFEFYKKSAIERNRYLTFYKYLHLLDRFGYYNETTHGKMAEYNTFSEYIHRPWMIADKNTDENTIISFINKCQIVFAKPDMGDQGKGVLKVKADDSISINYLLTEIKKGGSYVIEGIIQNSEAIRVLNPSSLNTVRAYTLLNKDGSTKILAIMLRVGQEGSHVDNWGSGGIGYNFDLETGICVDYGRDKINRPYVYHPGSLAKMIGFQLPRFKELKDFIITLSHIIPHARFVGWDIAITPDGFDLVEMNCPGGHDFLQAFGKPFGDILRIELL